MAATVEKDGHWAALMRSAQDGDRAAYVRLLRDIVPLLRQTVRRRRGFLQPPDIEDLVQDVLLSLHAVRATYDPRRPFLPWLMAIARNRMADGARQYARKAAKEVTVDKLPETFVTNEANTLMDAYRDPEALRRAIGHLPPAQRQAVEMLKLREMSLKEAAEVSGMSVGALKVAVHRGIIALRRALKPEG
jgi:RNA polymerase sigma-70 factor (ECF subfamily)